MCLSHRGEKNFRVLLTQFLYDYMPIAVPSIQRAFS
jgi:hypothetical protein